MGLSLNILGGFQIRDGSGKPLSLRTRKTQALLAYLAVNADKPQPRQRLIALLWSDRDERQARASLNNALVSIRQLGHGEGTTHLDSDGQQVTLYGAALETDVARFQALQATEPAEAAQIYNGPLLEGLEYLDPAFDDWLTATRSELHTKVCDALQRAADSAATRDDTKEAIDAARRLVTLDPLHESGHRLLMRMLHVSGDRVGALRQYQVCADILKEELQVEPDATTKALFEEIRNETLSTGEREPSASDAALTLPDKPSIAILPFENLSPDPDQEYLADGLAEDVITDLSRFRWFFVIARNSSFTYKGRPIDVKQVAKELGVRYVVEGSVRKVGNRVRVSVQLIDATTGAHIWAERYDRELDDIFALQDEITETIVAAIEPELAAEEQNRAQRKNTTNLDAWDSYQRGLWQLFDDQTIVGAVKARALFENAYKLDPQFSSAYAEFAYTYVVDIIQDRTDSFAASLAEAARAAKKAVFLDVRNPVARYVLGRVYCLQHDFESAIAEMEAALNLNPSFDRGFYGLGAALLYSGRPEEGIPFLEKAIRLNPKSPLLWAYFGTLGRAYFNLGRYEEAFEFCRKAAQQPITHFNAFIHGAAALGHLGQIDQARAMLSEIRTRKPDFTVQTVWNTIGRYGRYSGAERVIEGLRAAGLKDC